METVVFAALEQICSSQAAGLTLNHLYPKLTSNGFNLCPNIKKALWTNLLNTPSIRFQCNGVSYDSTDTRIQLVELAENMELRIVASECLVNSFLGVYDVVASDAGVSENQRVVLERLAVASFLGVYDVVASDAGVSENQRVVLGRLAVARIQLLELAENVELRIVASECLVNSFLGVYDVVASDFSVSENQRAVLERLAVA
ncbi:hypothetical protein Tco_0712692, partial [Tanacetum coccineum]